MKPQWKDAPAWANWRSIDDDGWIWYYENRPHKKVGHWVNSCGKSSMYDKIAVHGYFAQWEDSLEQRPETTVTARAGKREWS